MSSARKLRIFQLVCLVYMVPVLWVLHRLNHAAPRPLSVVQVMMVFLAIYCAWSGFSFQRRIGKRGRKPGGRSTPFKAWLVGHMMRLANAVAVCLCALVLRMFGGPAWLAYCIFGLGVILLLIWRPGANPARAESAAH